jgi:hypothetical protein
MKAASLRSSKMADMTDRTIIVLIVASLAIFASMVLITWYFLEPAKIGHAPPR